MEQTFETDLLVIFANCLFFSSRYQITEQNACLQELDYNEHSI